MGSLSDRGNEVTAEIQSQKRVENWDVTTLPLEGPWMTLALCNVTATFEV